MKLRTLQDRDVAHLLRMTLEEMGDEVDEVLYDALLEWLSSEAKLARSASHSIVEEEVAEWRASIYKSQQAARRQRQEDLLREMQTDHIKRKLASPPCGLKAATTGGQGRPPPAERLSHDEQLRDEWAVKGVEIVAKMGWLPRTEERDEGYLLRLRMRLKRGLRMRTIRQRVQTLDKMQRWCALTAGTPWFTTADQLEDYLMESARNKTPGVSSFERIRLALVYIESAVEPAEHCRLGQLAGPRLLMKELALKADETKNVAKREAPMYPLGLIERMERLVLGDSPTYVRAYTWLKLVTIWAAVRGEDCTWLQAASISMIAGVGLVANLLRSKTTGPGKKVRAREIFISQEAYVSKKDWLSIGLELWSGLDEGRENFILLPNLDLSSFRNIGAEVQDRVALTRHSLSLAVRLSHMESTTAADRCVGRFWTEHSSRNTIVSLARALKAPKEATDTLGCWAAANSSSEVYIRTKRQVVGHVQALVGKFARDALIAKAQDEEYPDFVGESNIFGSLEAFGEKFGFVDLDTSHLQTFGPPDADAAELLVRKYGWRTEGDHGSLKVLEGNSDEEKSVEPAPKTDGKLPNIDTWVVSTRADGLTEKGCLHIVGKCFRQPGVHYQRWVVVDATISSGQYLKACRQCFPAGLHQVSLQVETAEQDMEEGMPQEARNHELSSSSSE